MDGLSAATAGGPDRFALPPQLERGPDRFALPPELERGPDRFALPPELETPALVVDLDRLEANLARMAARARTAGVALRPHAKTHKCPPIGHRQLAAGAVGLTVATLGEAELFAAAGCPDLFIAYPLWAGGGRAARLRRLHERVRLRVGIDGPEAAELLAAATRGAAGPLPVLVEVDCGGRRTGVPVGAVAELAATCRRLGLEVRGAFTHPGHAYTGPDRVQAAAADERAALAGAGAALAGLVDGAPELSGGSSPTALAGYGPGGRAGPAATEIRPGTYVFGDRQQMRLAGLPAGQVALVVAARVVSTPRPGEAVLDAGSKALSTDRPAWLSGHGWLPDAPEAQLAAITEEHAVVTGLARPVQVGDLLPVIPNHVCTAVNLGREVFVVAGGELVDTWPVHGGVRRPPAA
jgi:D-serine deaminase-like pyridoxal phosphate-dependent protein